MPGYWFLALVLRKEPDRRLIAAGHQFEWAEIKQDLKALQSVTIEENGRRLAIPGLSNIFSRSYILRDLILEKLRR